MGKEKPSGWKSESESLSEDSTSNGWPRFFAIEGEGEREDRGLAGALEPANAEVEVMGDDGGRLQCSEGGI